MFGLNQCHLPTRTAASSTMVVLKTVIRDRSGRRDASHRSPTLRANSDPQNTSRARILRHENLEIAHTTTVAILRPGSNQARAAIARLTEVEGAM
ncbi:MAG: hypothetical protein AAF219_02690 [Myxococcota bacterium]